MKKKILIALGVLLGVVYVSNIIMMRFGPELPEPSTTPSSTYKVPEILTDTEIVMRMDDVLRSLYEERYSMDFSFSKEEKVLTVNLWDYHSTAHLLYASMGEQPYLDEWNEYVRLIAGSSESWLNTFERHGHEITFILNYVNPLDEEDIYISAVNGVLIYDRVSGLNILENISGK